MVKLLDVIENVRLKDLLDIVSHYTSLSKFVLIQKNNYLSYNIKILERSN